MNENMMNRSYEVQAEGDSLGRYTVKTFDWISAGLLVTLIVAADSAITRTIFYIYSFCYWPLALPAAELGAVIYLSARTEKMSIGMARSLFSLHAALNDIVFDAYLFVFSLETLQVVFGITALFSGIMALIGWFGNINSTRLRSFMLGGLVSLFFYWIFAVFIDSNTSDTIVSTVGVFLSLVLTAYDVKKIQAFHVYYGQVPEMVTKASAFSALRLYLDLTDLFVYTMRILGRRK